MLLVNETFGNRVTAFDVTAGGALTNRRVWAEFATGSRLLRLVAGKITDEVRPGTPVYACAVGGPDCRTLFACAAPDFFEHARRAATEGRIIALPI